MNNTKIDTDMYNQDEVFSALENVRESGVMNMFDATPFLVARFQMTNSQARAWLVHWMDSFS